MILKKFLFIVLVFTLPVFPVLADSPCPLSAKGAIAYDPLFENETTIKEICDGIQFQALESTKVDPIRKGIGTSDPQATLDINGGVKIGNDLSDCTKEKAGTIRWTGEFFEGCNGKEWISLQK